MSCTIHLFTVKDTNDSTLQHTDLLKLLGSCKKVSSPLYTCSTFMELEVIQRLHLSVIWKYIGCIRIDFYQQFSNVNRFRFFWKWSHMCTNSPYQAISLLPSGLGTRPMRHTMLVWVVYKEITMCGSPVWIIPSHILITSLCLKRHIAELPLRAGLICAL